MSSFIRQNINPTSIPGCQLWFDAADMTTMTFSGSTVTQWNDKSGNGRNATNGGYVAPTYSATGFNSGYPGLLFNGSSTMLNTAAIIPTPVLSSNGTDTTIFIVFNYTGVPGSGGYGLYGLGSQANTYVVRAPWAVGGAGGGAIVDTTSTTAGSRIVASFASAQAAAQVYSITRSGASHLFYQYGTLTASNLSSTGTVGTTSQTFGIGGGIADTVFFNSYISELIIYNVAITTAQQQQVEGYLAWKWGLQANFPSANPYISTPLYASVLRQNISLSLTNPLQLPGLIAWFDASDTTTYTPGASVTSWANKGSAGGNATTASGVSSTAATINGVPAMSFAATAVMTVPSMTYTNASKSVFAVVTVGASGSARSFFANSGAVIKLPQLFEGAANLQYTTSSTNIFLAPIGTTYQYSNTTSVLSGHNYLVTGTTYDGGLFVNGRLQILSTNAPQAFNTGTVTTATLGSATTTTFIMGEVLVYDSSLTPAQRQQVEAYLMFKWKVYVGATSAQIGQAILSNRTQGGLTFATFNPLSISGLTAWFDGADPAGTGVAPANASSITTWVDKSGGARNATGGVAPTYAAKSLNGLGTLTFNGSSQYLYASTLTVPTATHFMIAVHKPTLVNTSGGNGYTGILRAQSSGASGGYIVFPYGENAGYFSSFNGAVSLTPTGGVAGSWNMFEANVASGSTVQYQYGTAQAQTAASITATTSDSFTVGSFSSSGTSPQQYYQGSMAEIIVYNVTLTTVQRQNVEGYLAWKWGLQASLPSSHPFANFPPPP